ncbi:MAG: DUF983 domain-containing protein [Erythrobacter sp.]
MPAGSGQSESKGQPGIISAALSGLCPRCGARTLFDAPLRVAIECRACGLPLAQLERGGRLAGLLTMVIAAILITIALTIETTWQPPLWLQAVFWAPVTVLTVLGALRLYKTAMLYRQYETASERDE